MVGVNRKAFIRSVEAVLAILLFVGFYNVILPAQSESLRADPTIQIKGLMNALEQTGILNELVNTYSLRELSNIIKYSLSPTQGFKLELNYIEPIRVENENNQEVTRNISFIKMFPENTNTNSINVYDEQDKIQPVQVINNYYKVRITAETSNELNNNTILLGNVNIKTGTDENINTTSIRAYYENQRIPIELNSIDYNTNYYDANASLTLLIPYARKNSVMDLTIFYAADTTSELITYPILGTGRIVTYSAQEPEKAKASQVITTTTIGPNDERTLYLYYELNTITERTYNELEPDNNGIKTSIREDYYTSTNPLTTYQSTKTTNIETSIQTEYSNCKINIRVWDYE